MNAKVKRIIIFVSKDELTGSGETEEKEMGAFVTLQNALRGICGKHKMEVDIVDFHTQ